MVPNWLLRVTLADDADALAQVRHAAGAAADGVRLGGHCPACRRGILVRTAGERRPRDIEPALADAGSCLHASVPDARPWRSGG